MLNKNIFSDFKDVHWKAQDSTNESILFYKIGNSKNEEELFKERITQASYKYLVVNKQVTGAPRNTFVFPETDWPQLQDEMLNLLFPLPEIKLIGITGTNGKTTTTDLALQLGKMLGKKGLSIGTLGVRDHEKILHDFGMTSPCLIDLRKFLYHYGQDKDFCVMEVSSHALDQNRIYNIFFDAAGWLSFSQDHLDYHGNMEAYFKAKCLLLEKLKSKASLYVPREQTQLFQRLTHLSTKIKMTKKVESQDELNLFFKVQFNCNNLEVAYSIMDDLYSINPGIHFNELTPPSGRFYIRPYKGSCIVVDFAHTPDALENICIAIKNSFPQHRLKVLFGCGGDRDRTKRPLMARAVSQHAEEIYVTSDNPRNENPEQIIEDIVLGFERTNYKKIADRKLATQTAFSELKDMEVLLLAGKGHEDHILIKGVKYPYSDIDEVDNFISRN